MNSTTLTLGWEYPPQGLGSEFIVDNYTISISSGLQFTLDTYIVSAPPLNVTLGLNVIYSINITAENCAGESDAYILPDIEYGKHP